MCETGTYMSEKGNPVISQHDVGSSGCSAYNECIKSEINFRKESSIQPEKKYASTVNPKAILTNVIESNHGNINLTDLNSIPNLISSKVKSTIDQDLILNNNQITLPQSLLLPINSKNNSKNVASDLELTIPPVISSVAISTASVHSGDIVIEEFIEAEEWLKSKSDSLSSLDLDSEMKNESEIDMTDFLNPKSNNLLNSSSNSSITSDSVSRLTGGGIYNPESASSSSSFIQNSLNFESDGSLSSLSSGFDSLKNNKTTGNIRKMDNLVQVEKGLFEEMLLTDPLKKNLKLKDSIIGEDKGLFEELLIPGAQEWLFTVSSSDKKECISTVPMESLSVPQSPNIMSINEQDINNKNTFDEYDIIDRNINTLKLMTPQEIENMPTRSLGFDEGQFKEEVVDHQIGDLPFNSCEDKELSDLPSGANTNDVDHKLFNILAMDASNDTLDNNNFSENILDSIDQEPEKDITSENFIYNVDSDSSLKNSTLNATKNSEEINNFSNICLKNEIQQKAQTNIKVKQNLEKIKPLNYILTEPSSPVKPVLSNIKLVTKHRPTYSNITNNENLNTKNNKSLSVGVVQLKLSPKQQGLATCTEKKTGIITSLPQILIKPALIHNQGPLTVPVTESNIVNLYNLSTGTKQTDNALVAQNMAGIAKVNISVNCKANTTSVSIISSNKEHTVFKINTSDLMRAVSSIKEGYLEPLGLKSQQLIETANAAHKLLNVHSYYLKKGNEEDSLKNPQNFEINQYIQEVKTPISRSCATLSNVGHILATAKMSEMNPKNKNSKIDATNVSNTLQVKKVEEKSSQIKKLIIEKPRGHGKSKL